MIAPFIPKSSDVEQNISAFIDHWRPTVSALPHVDAFENDNWDLREAGSIEGASRGNKRLGLRFTKLNPMNQRYETRLLAQPMRDEAKAYALKSLVEHGYRSLTSMKALVNAFRYLEAHLLGRELVPSTANLTPDLLDDVNLAIRTSGMASGPLYEMSSVLNRLVSDLQEAGLIRTKFTWTGITPIPPSPMNRIGEAFESIRRDKLPTDKEMQSVGHVFHHGTTHQHQYPSSIAALLAGMPGRIGEVLTLPVDCDFDDERNGKMLYRIRWRPEKGAPPMTKDCSYATHPWISIYKEALRRLRDISAPAREIAAWYESNPGRIHLPKHLEHLRGKEWLSIQEVASILQLEYLYPSALIPNLERRHIPIHGKRYGTGSVRFEDVEQAVLSELPKGFPIYQRSSGLKYKEALCLIRKQEFSGNRKWDDSPSFTMIQKPNVDLIIRLLDKAFDDFGLTNEAGEPIRLRTHEFRHRWCTRAEEAGLWRAFNNAMSGRLRISQANAYDHMTADHLLKITAESVRDDGRIFGDIYAFTPRVPIYLQEVERQIEELAMLKAIVVTPFGICTNDFVSSPCEYHLDCLNCRNHVCVKGLPARTENIEKRLTFQEKALSLARVALLNGDSGVEEHILNTLEPNVQRLRGIVAILNDPRFKLGTEILLANGPQNHPVTKAIKARIDTLKAKGIETTTEESMLLPASNTLDLGTTAGL